MAALDPPQKAACRLLPTFHGAEFQRVSCLQGRLRSQLTPFPGQGKQASPRAPPTEWVVLLSFQLMRLRLSEPLVTPF